MLNNERPAETAADSSTLADVLPSASIAQSPMLPAVAGRKLRPILFSPPMVQAILEGRKCQTRRLLKKGWNYMQNGVPYALSLRTGQMLPVACPYGKAGDVLWVRESWSPKYVKGGLDGFRGQYPNVHPWIYRATDFEEHNHGYAAKGWKPSIHMPYEACRLWLEIKSIHVERLQDITEADAKAEGVDVSWMYASAMVDSVEQKKKFGSAYVGGFAALWCHINGAQSWDENPFVWVVEFERCPKP